MTWLNRDEVVEHLRRWDDERTPHLYWLAQALQDLVIWTDAHSDGWSSWPKPSRAAGTVMTILEGAARRLRDADGRSMDDIDLPYDEARRALSPVKAFFTRQGADWSTILPPPPRTAPRR